MRLPEAAKPATLERRVFQGLLPFAGSGIDVGAGRELPPAWRWWEQLGMRCRPWDAVDGDAHMLEGIGNNQYDWLTASHILEHLAQPETALRNWLRVVKPRAPLLVAVPHRQLYEQRRALPSRWNPRHLRYYLPYKDDGKDTVGLFKWLSGLEDQLGFTVERLVTGDWGHTNTGGGAHPDGEYQIDALLRKDSDTWDS